jgi:adenylyl cyclase-associated protein
VEHHTKESAASVGENGMLIVDVSDPKQQVYIFNCECTNVNLVFGSCLAACEMVNCKKIQIQTTGMCPSFSIDKTIGCLVYLSHDAIETTSFVTSQSSEMNGKCM